MRRLTAINYGVYVFDYTEYLKPQELLLRIKDHFGFKTELTILMTEP